MVILALALVVIAILVAVIQRLNDAKQTMLFAVWTGGEVQVGGNSRRAASAEGQAPQAINGDGTFFRTFEQASKLAVCLEAHNGTAAEIANQQLVGVLAESARREGHAPRRVHRAKLAAGCRTCRKTTKCSRSRVKYVDQPIPAARYIVVPGCILLCEGDYNHLPYGLNVKGRVVHRRVSVPKLSNQVKVGIICIDGGFPEVGGQQQGASVILGHQCDALVNRTFPFHQRFGGVTQVGTPAGDRAVFARKEEQVGVEAISGIGDLACRGPVGRAVARDGDYQRNCAHMRGAGDVVGHGVEGGLTSGVVADPKWEAGMEGDSPGVYEV